MNMHLEGMAHQVQQDRLGKSDATPIFEDDADFQAGLQRLALSRFDTVARKSATWKRECEIARIYGMKETALGQEGDYAPTVITNAEMAEASINPLSQCIEDLEVSQEYQDDTGTESEGISIPAFAMLEFKDSDYYMNTRAIELGRDIQASKEIEREQRLQRQRENSTPGAAGEPLQGEGNADSRTSRISSPKIVQDDQTSSTQTAERKQRKPRSATPSPGFQYPPEPKSLPITNLDYNARVVPGTRSMSSLSTDTSMPLMPPDDIIPLIPIRPSMEEGGLSGPKSISKRHVRIAWNGLKHLFEIQFLGRNGGFLDDAFYAQGQVRPLLSGSVIQIGGVSIGFKPAIVPTGRTGGRQTGDCDSTDTDSTSGSESDSDVPGLG